MKHFIWLAVLLLAACASPPKTGGSPAAVQQRPSVAAPKAEAAPRTVPVEEKQPTQSKEVPGTPPRKKPKYFEED